MTDKVWHVGKGGYSYIHSDARNSNTVGIEIGTFRDSQGRWMFTEEAQETAAQLAAAILTIYSIPLDHLLRHGDVTTKCCPMPLMPVERGGFEGEGSNWTWEKFKSRVAELMGSQVSDVLQKGCQGEEVKRLQEDLIALGYSCGGAGADGSFGDGTYAAVTAFQKACGLVRDGIVGTDTRKALGVAAVQAWLNRLNNAGLFVDGQYGPKTKEALATALQKALVEIYGCRIAIDGSFGPETKAICRTIGKGDKGLLVSILQAGLLVHGIRGTRIDAIFGDGTEEGVQEFQREAGVTIDGIADPDTFEKLLG